MGGSLALPTTTLTEQTEVPKSGLLVVTLVTAFVLWNIKAIIGVLRARKRIVLFIFEAQSQVIAHNGIGAIVGAGLSPYFSKSCLFTAKGVNHMFYRPKNIGAALLLLLFSLCTASATRADTVTLTGFGDTLWEGVPVGLYPGALNGTPTDLLCLSYDRHVAAGVPFEVTINALNPLGVSNALYGPQLLGYQQAAWLYDQMLANPSETGDIHGAIWRLFTPGVPTTPGSNWWYNLVTTDPATLAMIQAYDFSRFRIVTPNDTSINGQQEFLTTVPEPTTMLLLGTGLVGVAAKARRRRKAVKTEEA